MFKKSLFNGIGTPAIRAFQRPLNSQRLSPLRRWASSSPNNKKPDDKSVSVGTYLLVSVVATVIMTQVVDAVNKEDQKPTLKPMSETEYYKQQQRLKRRVAKFEKDDKQVFFVRSNGGVISGDINIDGYTTVAPDYLVELEKNDETSKFHALLNDPDTKMLPRGLVIDLIGKFLQSKPDGKFLVLNYPTDVKESTQFEEKIVTIQKLIELNQDDKIDQDNLFKYYKTVNKAEEIKSIDDLSKALSVN